MIKKSPEANRAETAAKMALLEKLFRLPPKKLKCIIRKFQSEMDKGLAFRQGSLKMIPAYVDIPTGNEKGSFLALDLGGTNLRVLKIELEGNRKASSPRTMNFVLDKHRTSDSAAAFFDFIASSVEKFIRRYNESSCRTNYAGFTFSFPVVQTGVASGRLISWTKGFDVKDTVGRDVVRLLESALKKKGINNVKISALANDTVGTLAAGSYKEPYCDIGVIVGTGTNACYLEDLANIKKWDGPVTQSGKMIINIEWGNFNKIASTPFDKRLDRQSNNPGRQILEKMVSGLYLGEVARLVLSDLGKSGSFSRKLRPPILSRKNSLTAGHMSVIEADRSQTLGKVGKILREIGAGDTDLGDRKIVRRVCDIVSQRAARLVASCIAAIILKKDPVLTGRHTVAIDGSVYEKHPSFSKHMRCCLRELLGDRSSCVRITLTKDGSGKGAAIIAAIASAPSQ